MFLPDFYIPLASSTGYLIVEPFPCWWDLEFRKFVTTGDILRTSLSSRTCSYEVDRSFAFESLPASAIVFKFEPVYLPDSFPLVVFVIAWPVSDITGDTRSIRMKIDIQPLVSSLRTDWRLDRVLFPNVSIQNLQSRSLWKHDVAVVPSFRNCPFRRLVNNPWGNKDFSFGEGYPADWYLPFFSAYNTHEKHGFWFFVDDHLRDPTTGSGPGWSTNGFVVKNLKEQATDSISLRIAHPLRIDQAELSGPSHVFPYSLSGSVLLESFSGESFHDYYDLTQRYRGLVEASPPVQRRSNPDYPGYRPIPKWYQDQPIVLAPLGEWKRYTQVPALGDLRMQHVEDITKTYSRLLADTAFFDRPAFYFQSASAQWEGEKFLPPGSRGPRLYGRIRPKYRSLVQWAKRPPNRGFSMGYVIPNEVPRGSPDECPSLYILNEDGLRDYFYCWSSLQFREILRGNILDGALGHNVGLDGLHFDGILPTRRCADRNHAHRSVVRNEQYAAIHENLELLHRQKDNLILDQEVPIEGLMDVFESCAGEAFKTPDSPPLFRMIYGSLNRYSYPIIVMGENPQWGDHTLFDMKALLPLKDGVLPVIVFLDTPGSFTANEDPEEPVQKILRSYLLSYEKLLKPAFQGDMVRMPEIQAPECGVYALRGPLPKGPGTLIMSKTDPVVQGSAFAWNELGTRRAAVVLMNWATTYHAFFLKSEIVPYQRHTGLPQEYIQIDVGRNAGALSSSHRVILSLVASDLTLSASTRYRVSFQALGGKTLQLGTLQARAIYEFVMEQASLGVVNIVEAMS